MPFERTIAEQLTTAAQHLPGVGPQRAELFERLGLATVGDVLFHFPRSYEDLTDRREVVDLEEGKLQSVLGLVDDIEQRTTRRGNTVLGILLKAHTGYLRLLWFNQPFQRERFALGQRLLASGKAKRNGLMWEMSHPRIELLDPDEPEPTGKILPVYPATEGLQQWQIRKATHAALGFAHLLEEAFPPEVLETKGLWPIQQALTEIHFPTDQSSLTHARRRFVYQELFVLQLALAVKRVQQLQHRKAPQLDATPRIDARIRRLFPYQFTPGQEEAIAQIVHDMSGAAPMNRLLQGDVGSGKTAVAVYAMLLAVAHGHQAVLMAPTEVLARQHAQTLDRLLRDSQVRRLQLIGGLTGKARAEALEPIAAGQVDLIIGTHAVLQEDVRFARLGLVVIDEQHKFGVRQRAMLRQAGGDPHYLVMTATPIPRTITMTLFGDLEVSTIHDAPPGRQKVHTYLPRASQRARWWDFFCRKLREGRQGFVVVPLVEESEQLTAASIDEAFESLAHGPLEGVRLGLISGRLNSDEKDAVMDRFRSGDLQVLISTPVIEVGVDVPNATIMTIEAGERFGLAQLHQLRGRVSRGQYPGFCAVFANPQTNEAARRLEAFQASTDGFQLAEIDFQLRGPGEIFGTRQHGLPPFRIADLVRDAALVVEARHDAQAMATADPGLARAEHARLRKLMLARYGKALDLGDVG